MPEVAAVIFDLYGTLVDFSARRLDQTLVDLATILGLSHPDYGATNADKRIGWEEGVYETLEAHFEDVCSAHGLDTSSARIHAAVERCLEFGRLGLEPRAEALETLAWLRSTGYRIGVISNCSNEVPLLWPHTSLAHLVDTAVFSCLERVRKPDPRIYQAACFRLQVSPEACLYVGDGGSNELTGAAAVGMRAIGLCVPDEDAYDVERLGRQPWSGPTISRLGELRELLGR
jgi:putative hydrolase of the HAD superfamily